jgi:methylmalonyl-CoA mutase N-terminal domain/subunit
VESGQRIVVGVNRFHKTEDRAVPTFRLDPQIECAQIERLRNVRASRSRPAVEARLSSLEEAARGTANLMPAILDAADAYATVGEISDRLRRVFGEYREG